MSNYSLLGFFNDPPTHTQEEQIYTYEAAYTIPLFWLCLFNSSDIYDPDLVYEADSNNQDTGVVDAAAAQPDEGSDEQEDYSYLYTTTDQALQNGQQRRDLLVQALSEEQIELYDAFITKIEDFPENYVVVNYEDLAAMSDAGDFSANIRQCLSIIANESPQQWTQYFAFSDVTGLDQGSDLQDAGNFTLTGSFDEEHAPVDDEQLSVDPDEPEHAAPKRNPFKRTTELESRIDDLLALASNAKGGRKRFGEYIKFYPFNIIHVLLLIVPPIVGLAGAFFGWWYTVGAFIFFIAFVFSYGRMQDRALEFNFDSREVIHEGAHIPFSSLNPKNIQIVSDNNSSNLNIVLSDRPVSMFINFNGDNHQEDAKRFKSALWQLMQRKPGNESDAAETAEDSDTEDDNDSQAQTLASPAALSRPLYPSELWMLQPSELLLPLFSGYDLKNVDNPVALGNNSAVAQEIFSERWNAHSGIDGMAAVAEAMQGLRGRMASLQPIALLPQEERKTYLELLKNAAEELSQSAQVSDNDSSIPVSAPGPIFSKLLEQRFGAPGLEIFEQYTAAVKHASDTGMLSLLRNVELASVIQARMSGEIVLIGIAAKYMAEVGYDNYHNTIRPYLDSFASKNKNSKANVSNLMLLQDMLWLHSHLRHNEALIEQEQDRLNVLADPALSITKERNPFIAWDYARASFLKRLDYTAAWSEIFVPDIWDEFQPMALELQASFSSYEEMLPYIIAGHRLSANSHEFGTLDEFSAAINEDVIRNALTSHNLPWNTPLTKK